MNISGMKFSVKDNNGDTVLKGLDFDFIMNIIIIRCLSIRSSSFLAFPPCSLGRYVYVEGLAVQMDMFLSIRSALLPCVLAHVSSPDLACPAAYNPYAAVFVGRHGHLGLAACHIPGQEEA